MKAQWKWTAMACAVAVGLAACGGEADAPVNGSAMSASTASNQQPDQALSAKTADRAKAFNQYVGAHNAVSGMFYGSTQGVDNLLAEYQAQDLSNGGAKVNKNIGPRLLLNTSMLGNMIRELESAQASLVGGDLQGLEAAGKQVLASGKTLLAQAEDLDAYFTSKKFLDDGYAKAKADNAAFVEKWTRFNQDFQAFSQQLDEVERKERLSSIATYTKEGKLREAAAEQVFLEAGDVLKLIGSDEDLNNADKMAKADAHMQTLDAALTQLKTESDKATDGNSSDFKSTYDYFNQFAGNWRELKANKDVSKFNDMVENYNNAVRFRR